MEPLGHEVVELAVGASRAKPRSRWSAGAVAWLAYDERIHCCMKSEDRRRDSEHPTHTLARRRRREVQSSTRTKSSITSADPPTV